MRNNTLTLARDKGFQPKTLSTKWTWDGNLTKKLPLITDTCELLLLHEIQMWLREDKGLEIIIGICPESDYTEYEYSVVDTREDKTKWYNSLSGSTISYAGTYPKYSKTLEVSIKEAIKLI